VDVITDTSVVAAGRDQARRTRIETARADRRTRRRWDTRRASRSVTRGSMPTVILIATSGMAAGRNATAVAAQLAKRLGAELTLVHVVAPIEYRVGRLTPTLTITGRLADPQRSPVLRDALLIAASSGVPDECIDCDACVEACPVDAIFAEDQLPDEWQHYTKTNADYYKTNP
jgi:ferredoxin